MKRTIVLNGNTVIYVLFFRKDSKTLRIRITEHGDIRVIVPKRATILTVENYMRSKSNWITDTVAHIKSSRTIVSSEEMKLQFKKHKKDAHELISKKLEYFNSLYCFSYKKISIRDQKTRWGSCSATGALSFNYKILLLEEDLIDYIVVHELCHLQELNHGKQFWELVRKEIPDYLERRKRLRNLERTIKGRA